MQGRTPRPTGGTTLLDAIQAFREEREPNLTLRDLSRELGIDAGLFSKYCHGQRRVPDNLIDKICSRLCLAPELCKRLRVALHNSPGQHVDDPLANAEVVVLSYGHLTVEELNLSILKEKRFTGPTGLLIECFQRFADFAGAERLQPQQKRTTLKGVVSNHVSHSILLGNIATVERIIPSYFFCTPVTIGIQGLIVLKDIPDREHTVIDSIRNTLAGRGTKGCQKVAPIYMIGEIGSYIVRSNLHGARSAAHIEDLRVERYVDTVKGTFVADSQRPVILADELTCLLTLKACDPGELAILFADPSSTPRFPFGFSISRQDPALIKWFKAAWELYIQTDANHICEMYLSTYEGLVEFAKGLRDCYGSTFYDQRPDAWAAKVMGVDKPTVPSSLVSSAWKPIIDQVYRMVNY